jgi:hypothetical protein
MAEVAFTLIDQAGTESVLVGEFWADAPAVNGQRAAWVVVDQRWWLVVTASKRHRCARGGVARRGRWVDVGEVYSQGGAGTPSGTIQRLRRRGLALTSQLEALIEA